ncbi:MAG: T9SS type A sorting domain-containing protein, partial [Bacteroidetes bacterium]|nr:T9SS type A sorting domain-containing protein [Bacteroidota bacterium]
AGGGTTSYTYLWSNGSPNPTAGLLTAGDYTATVSDANGCSATSTVTVTEPATALTATASVTSNVSCNGGNDGSAAVAASGGTSTYTYLWSNNSPNPTAGLLTAGDYTATVSDANGCSATSTVTVTEPTALTATATISAPICGNSDGSITAISSGGTGPYSYSWNTTPAQSTDIATGLTGVPTETLIVTVIDANGCTISYTDSVSCFDGIIINHVESNINAYPNPNFGEFNIELNSALSNDYTIELSNMLGQVMYSESLTSFSGKYSKSFDVKQYGEGIYFMNIRSDEGQLMRKVVVY